MNGPTPTIRGTQTHWIVPSKPAPPRPSFAATLTTRLRMLDLVGQGVMPAGTYRCTIDSVDLVEHVDDTPRPDLEADVDAIMRDLQRRERGGYDRRPVRSVVVILD